MMRRMLFLLSMFTLGLSLIAFPQAKPPVPAAPPEDPPPVLTVPPGYKYNAQARRDPFVNPVPKPKPTVVAPPTARPPGLKGVLIAEAGIAGVVTSQEPTMNVVIIAAPGAKTPYFARVGDRLYDAVVKSIKLDTVTFALTTPAATENATREIVRKVRPMPGEDK